MKLVNSLSAQFERKCRFFSKSGSPLKTLYHLKYSENGVQMLEVCGETNLYSEIQSHRESTDLAYILRHLDPMQTSGFFNSYSFDDLLNSNIIDVTSLPKNAGDMLNLVREGKNIFDGLPLEIREEFNFSPEKFVSSFGSKDFAEKMNRLNEKYNGSFSNPIYDVSKNGRIKKHVDNGNNVNVNDVNVNDVNKEVNSNESK